MPLRHLERPWADESARGTEEDSGTDENTMEASNQPLQTDYPESGPHWSFKSFMDVKVNSS
jgi:hypothetical protein